MSNIKEIEKQISFFTDLRREMKTQEKNAESELLRYYYMGKISAYNDIISALLALKRNCTE